MRKVILVSSCFFLGKCEILQAYQNKQHVHLKRGHNRKENYFYVLKMLSDSFSCLF